jgi:glycosyltransferase involved in cell wall biosynthesis
MPPVLLNARAAARPELGGVERWAREVCFRLPRLAPARYVAVRPPPALVHRAGHGWEQLVLPALAARRRAPLLLNPANLAPLAFPRNVVVVHDAAPLRRPEWYSPAYAAYQRALLPRIARRAVRVITVSEFSRRELAEILDVDATVVAGGLGPAFGPDADPEPARRAFGLARPYVLTVASRTSRKNLAVLEEAARRLALEGVELVAAGGRRPQFASETPVPGIRDVGRVPEALLPGLYGGAEAFALPSRYEGFGLPCLEAMACGVPVAAANAAALPEVCGDAAVFADPDDPVAFAGAIDAARRRRAELVPAGRARAMLFNWDRTARELDAVLGASALA